MSKGPYILQLEKKYNKYLKDVIAGNVFEPIILYVKKNESKSYAEFQEWLSSLTVYQKKKNKKGWELTRWKPVSREQRKLMNEQIWPQVIEVNTEEDFLLLIDKKAHASQFKIQLAILLGWNPGIREFLLHRPERILRLKDVWKDIFAVIDYLLLNDVSDHYKRSIPIPVHSKFLEMHESIVLELLHNLHPEKFLRGKDLEAALSLKIKPYLFKMRWLDKKLADMNSSGMEVLAATTPYLQTVNWRISRIIFVENETNLYLLPHVPDTLAIFSSGKALHMLKEIGLFTNTAIMYWGDLDEDGYMMLNSMRKQYHHVNSLLMDEETVEHHFSEIGQQPHKYKNDYPDMLTETEGRAFEKMKAVNGRIEQERLQQSYVIGKLLIMLIL
jgi:hypothetical protein